MGLNHGEKNRSSTLSMFDVALLYIRPTGNPCSKEQRKLMWCVQLRQESD